MDYRSEFLDMLHHFEESQDNINQLYNLKYSQLYLINQGSNLSLRLIKVIIRQHCDCYKNDKFCNIAHHRNDLLRIASNAISIAEHLKKHHDDMHEDGADVVHLHLP